MQRLTLLHVHVTEVGRRVLFVGELVSPENGERERGERRTSPSANTLAPLISLFSSSSYTARSISLIATSSSSGLHLTVFFFFPFFPIFSSFGLGSASTDASFSAASTGAFFFAEGRTGFATTGGGAAGVPFFIPLIAARKGFAASFLNDGRGTFGPTGSVAGAAFLLSVVVVVFAFFAAPARR